MAQAPAVGPALPWAANEPVAEAQTLPEEPEEDEEDPEVMQLVESRDGVDPEGPSSIPLSDTGLELGQRVEVCWLVDEEQYKWKWWPATVAVMDPSVPTHHVHHDSSDDEGEGEDSADEGDQQEGHRVVQGGGAGSSGPLSPPKQSSQKEQDAQDTFPAEHIFCLRYEAWESFEEEGCNVVFRSKHRLFDLARGSVLFYRVEGDAWEPLVKAPQYKSEAHRQRALARSNAEIVDSLAVFGPVKQRAAVAALHDMLDGLKEHIEGLAQGGTDELTGDHIHDFFREFKKRRHEE